VGISFATFAEQIGKKILVDTEVIYQLHLVLLLLKVYLSIIEEIVAFPLLLS
jgi:tetrahydromethanopterin S-methyltransferase subunit G